LKGKEMLHRPLQIETLKGVHKIGVQYKTKKQKGGKKHEKSINKVVGCGAGMDDVVFGHGGCVLYQRWGFNAIGV